MPDDQTSVTRNANEQYLSPVPAAIRRQSELADEIARQAGIANVPEPKPEAQGEATGEATASPTVEGTGQEQAELPGLPRGEPQPQAQPAPDEQWQQRYNTLKGKYDSEIPELQAQLRSLERLIATMQSAPRHEAREAPRQEARPAAPPAPAAYDIPAEDREAYGEELISKSQAWAEARIAPQLSRLERRLIEIEGRSQQTAQQSAQQQVEAALDRAMPDWQQINNDPSFWAWLNQPDPFSGNQRRQLITDAHVRGDAARTLAFFQAFKREHTIVDPGAGTQPVQTAPAADRLPLENLAAPGRGSAAPAAPGAPQKRTWNTQQVTALFREKTRGQWDGREDEFRRLEQDIHAAAREGRFRN